MLWTKCVFVVSVYTYLLLLIGVATVSGRGGDFKDNQKLTLNSIILEQRITIIFNFTSLSIVC